MRKQPDPRQTDLIHMLHYQHTPEFIGPLLPSSHPAYRAYIARPRPTLTPLPDAFVRFFLNLEIAKYRASGCLLSRSPTLH